MLNYVFYLFRNLSLSDQEIVLKFLICFMQLDIRCRKMEGKRKD